MRGYGRAHQEACAPESHSCTPTACTDRHWEAEQHVGAFWGGADVVGKEVTGKETCITDQWQARCPKEWRDHWPQEEYPEERVKDPARPRFRFKLP